MWLDWWVGYCVYWHFVAPNQIAALISGIDCDYVRDWQ